MLLFVIMIDDDMLKMKPTYLNHRDKQKLRFNLVKYVISIS